MKLIDNYNVKSVICISYFTCKCLIETKSQVEFGKEQGRLFGKEQGHLFGKEQGRLFGKEQGRFFVKEQGRLFG